MEAWNTAKYLGKKYSKIGGVFAMGGFTALAINHEALNGAFGSPAQVEAERGPVQMAKDSFNLVVDGAASGADYGIRVAFGTTKPDSNN
ncbi:MAG TPA: hypothetical protein VI957_01820 [Candidatus Paceibacterota bacterium]